MILASSDKNDTKILDLVPSPPQKLNFAPLSSCNCIHPPCLSAGCYLHIFMRPVSTKVSPPLKFLGGASLQKELQGFASFVSFQNACFRDGTAMTKLTQERLIADQYFGIHGDPDSVGLSQQLVDGTGLFAYMYDTADIAQQTSSQQTAVSGGKNRNQIAMTLVLKPFLHWIPDTSIFVGSQPHHINLTLLHSNSMLLNKFTPIKGRSLLSRAQEHIKNGEKALSAVLNKRSPYKAYATTGNLPSGMSMDDYYVYVRKRMFVMLVTNPEKSKALKKATLPVVSTTTLASPVGVLVAIPNGDHFSGGERENHDDASTTATSLISATTNMSTNNSTFDADDANNTNTPTNAEEEGDGNEEDAVFDEEFDDGGDLMPDDWTFPGFIAFALLGPIVPPPMIPYRSELLMTVLPAQDSGDGRAALRKAERESKRKANVIKSKVTAPDVLVLERQVSTIPPNQQSSVSMQQKIMIAGIAQSKMLIEQRQHFKMNDRVLSLYQKKVAAQRMLINELKFMISITPIDDPERNLQIQNLKAMNEGLKMAVAELIGAEEKIVAKDLAASTNNKVANNFIDLTIARVLGDNDNNNASGDTFQIDLTLEDEKKEKSTSATPISSNKKSRLLCNMNITTPAASEASATTSSSAYGETPAQLGISIPTFCLTNVEVSPLLDNTSGDDYHLFEGDNEI